MQYKPKVTKIELGEKIIDITDGNEAVVPMSGPYYLTESGKLLTKNGTSYDKINRNHISRIGALDALLFINEDNTLETLRSYNSNEYMDIIDENDKKIKIKYIFLEISDRWTNSTSDHFYVVDDDDNLLDFSKQSLMVASEYYESKGKVTKLQYNSETFKMEITFNSGESIVIDDVYQYDEIKQ